VWRGSRGWVGHVQAGPFSARLGAAWTAVGAGLRKSRPGVVRHGSRGPAPQGAMPQVKVCRGAAVEDSHGASSRGVGWWVWAVVAGLGSSGYGMARYGGSRGRSRLACQGVVVAVTARRGWSG
jgi:hypothetical protein